MNSKRFSADLNQTPQSLSAEDLTRMIVWHPMENNTIALAVLTIDQSLDVDPLVQCLGEIEKQSAALLADVAERRHFICRRVFQRAFTAALCGWTDSISKLPMIHQQDSPPRCEIIPHTTLSFSSSANTYCACASATHHVGIDVEQRRFVENCVALAHRFFTRQEADIFVEVEADVQSELFLQIWTAKEAGLKALGLGVVSGLDKINVDYDGHAIVLRGKTDLTLVYPELGADNIIAVVHREKL
jgi:phosphopantetheine--protein transferase-like protein